MLELCIYEIVGLILSLNTVNLLESFHCSAEISWLAIATLQNACAFAFPTRRTFCLFET